MAVDSNTSVFGGLFGGGSYSSNDPSMNVSVSSNPIAAQLSPYMQIDPSLLGVQDEFITLENQNQNRGRMELAFSQIGGLCMLGGAVGGAQGLYTGFKSTAHLNGPIRRTQMLNYITKRVGGTSTTLGTIAVLYAGLGVACYYARDKKEDNLNSYMAAGLTGFLYQSPAGLKKAGIGGLVGLAFAGVLTAFQQSDNIDKFNTSIRF